MSVELAVILAVVVAGVLGYLTPLLVRALPEPPDRPEEDKSAAEIAEGPKESYVDVAALGWFAPTAMVVSGAGAGLVAWTLGANWVTAGLTLLIPVLVALAVVDLRTRLLPAIVVLPALWVSLVLVVLHAAFVATWADLQRALTGLLVAYVFYFVMRLAYRGGMGAGDVRLSALLGLVLAYLGWPQFAVGMYSGFLLLGVPGLVLALVRRDRGFLRSQYPFGPFMIAGVLVGILFGPALLGAS